MKQSFEQAFLNVNGVYIKIRKIPKTAKKTTAQEKNNIIYLFPQNKK